MPPPESRAAADPSARMRQVLNVLSKVRERAPGDRKAVGAARRAATVAVAGELAVNERSVADKCWRGLGFNSIDQFDDLLRAWILTEVRARGVA